MNLILMLKYPKPVITSLKLELSNGFTCSKLQFFANGNKIGEPVDCYAEKDKGGLQKVTVGNVNLKEGDNLFNIEFTGTNPKAYKQKYMEAAVDYIKLTPR